MILACSLEECVVEGMTECAEDEERRLKNIQSLGAARSVGTGGPRVVGAGQTSREAGASRFGEPHDPTHRILRVGAAHDLSAAWER